MIASYAACNATFLGYLPHPLLKCGELSPTPLHSFSLVFDYLFSVNTNVGFLFINPPPLHCLRCLISSHLFPFSFLLSILWRLGIPLVFRSRVPFNLFLFTSRNDLSHSACFSVVLYISLSYSVPYDIRHSFVATLHHHSVATSFQPTFSNAVSIFSYYF